MMRLLEVMLCMIVSHLQPVEEKIVWSSHITSFKQVYGDC